MKHMTIALICVLGLFASSNAFAADRNIYIDSSASSGQGTYDSPHRTFSEISWGTIRDWIADGHNVTINLKAGSSWDAEFLVRASGRSNNYLKIKAYGSGDKPVIDRNSYNVDTCLDVGSNDYIIIEGLAFRDADVGIDLIDTQYTVIKNCYFTNLDKGIYSNDAYYVTVGGAKGDGNTFYNIGHDTGSSDISVNSGSHDWLISHNHMYADSSTRGIDGVLIERVYDILVEYNTIHGHNDAEGNRGENAIDIKYDKTHHVVIRYNNMYDYQWEGVMHVQKGVHEIYIYGNRVEGGRTGIMVAYGWNDGNANPYNVHIYSNLILSNDNSGISDGNGSPHDVFIYNNTIAGNGKDSYGSTGSGIGYDNGDRFHVRNNIFYENLNSNKNDNRQIYVDSGQTDDIVLSNNLFYHPADGDDSKVYWAGKLRTASEISTGNECISPSFDNKYRLQPGSPAIEKGVNLSGVIDSITVTGGDGTSKVVQLDYSDGLHPANTDWSTIPPKVAGAKRSSTQNWAQGAYVYSDLLSTLTPPLLKIKDTTSN